MPYVDPDQGIQKDGRRFGYVGEDDKNGWFFSYPESFNLHAKYKSHLISIREEIVDSLEIDEIGNEEETISEEEAESALREYLEENWRWAETEDEEYA